MLRLHLNYTPDEVKAMPWWERRMWVEKLQQHLTPPDEDDENTEAFVQPSSVSDDVAAFGISPESLA